MLEQIFKKNNKALDKLEKGIEKQILSYYTQALKEIRSRIAYYNEKGVFNQNEMFRYNRLANLEKQISKEIVKINGKSANTLKNGLAKLYEESYYMTGYAFEKTLDTKLGFTLLKKELIEEVINNPFDRIGWNNRNKDNIAYLVKKLKEEIANGLIQGKSYRDISKQVKDRMGIGASKAIRIVQTEGHRVRESARFEGMKQARNQGVEMQKRWLATLDSRTRDRHQRLDGQTVDLDERFSNGLMYPGDPSGPAKEVINCRCTQISILGEEYEPKVRRSRDENNKGEIIPYTNYQEWFRNRIANK
jgi:SPP1 gp7 family putative phage head morphogenesis protein